MKLTEDQVKEYVSNGFNKCPVCKSPDVSGGFVEVDGNEAWQKCSCNECHAEWNDLYKLHSVEILDN